MSDFVRPIRKPSWLNISFFAVTTFFGVLVAPLYIARHGISVQEIALTFFYVVATGMSITVGYHRLFAHQTFKANRFVQFLALFFGAAAFEQSAMDWSSQHRNHHRFVDTDDDPYSIKKGFFYAHIGWLTLWKHTIDHSVAKDLQKNSLVVAQDRFYHAWAIVSGVLVPVAVGALFGHAWGAFLLAVCFRIVMVHHSTFLINSACHMFGKSTYDVHSTAKDHWLVAYLTNGEGYHNFHHRFPMDYRNGVRWYQWDPSKWTIALLEKIGWAWDLKKTSKFVILEAKIAAERQRAAEYIARMKDSPVIGRKLPIFESRYEFLMKKLAEWEVSAKSYQALILDSMSARSEEIKRALGQMDQARLEFIRARHGWTHLFRAHIPQVVYSR